VDFKEEPYDTQGKYAIYIPKPKDYIAETLEKFQKSKYIQENSYMLPQKYSQTQK